MLSQVQRTQGIDASIPTPLDWYEIIAHTKVSHPNGIGGSSGTNGTQTSASDLETLLGHCQTSKWIRVGYDRGRRIYRRSIFWRKSWLNSKETTIAIILKESTPCNGHIIALKRKQIIITTVFVPLRDSTDFGDSASRLMTSCTYNEKTTMAVCKVAC